MVQSLLIKSRGSKMHSGEVIYPNTKKNFGIIVTDAGETYFFHKEDVKTGIINDGDKVRFAVRPGNLQNTKSAYNISRLHD